MYPVICPALCVLITKPVLLFALAVTDSLGRAVARAVSRWIPNTEARVRAWVKSCGI
jgi:hypothetical protein